MIENNKIVSFLVLGDLHGREPEILVDNKDFDAIILPGDICSDDIRKYVKKWIKLKTETKNYDLDFYSICPKWKEHLLSIKSRWKGRQILKKLNKIGKPVFLVPGNWDPTPNDGFVEENQKVKNKSYDKWNKIINGLENVYDIENKKKEFMGITLIGSGSTSAPEILEKPKKRDFFDYEEFLEYNERYNYFSKVYNKLSNFCKKSKNPVILLTHNAMYNTKLDKVKQTGSYANNKHYGSILARNLVEKNDNIILQIGGHIHEGYGKQKVKKTMCVNSGFGSKVNTIVKINVKKRKIEKIEFFGENSI